MSDEKLRELERRFRETGSADDEVAWLRGRARSGEKLNWVSYSRLHDLDADAAADYLRWRVETGDITQERLQLAAYCGHLAATANVESKESPSTPPLSLIPISFRSLRSTQHLAWDSYLTGLAAWGVRPTAIAVFVAVADSVTDDFEGLRVVDDWLRGVPGSATRALRIATQAAEVSPDPLQASVELLCAVVARDVEGEESSYSPGGTAAVAAEAVALAIRGTEPEAIGGILEVARCSVARWALTAEVPTLREAQGPSARDWT